MTKRKGTKEQTTVYKPYTYQFRNTVHCANDTFLD